MKKILCLFFTFLMSAALLQGSTISWSSPPAVLSGAGLNASNPQVAIDASGNAVAAWIENNHVKSSTKLVSGNWTPEVTVSATGASSVNLVSDSSGNATAIWVENGVIKTATKPFNANWSGPITLSNNGSSSPTLNVDAAGDVIAAWVRKGSIETSTKLFGMSWQARVSINSSSASSPSIAVGGSGLNTRAVVVWQGICGEVNAVYASTKLLWGAWSTEEVISQVEHNAAQPFVAVDANANALAVWYSYDIVGNSYTNVVVNSSERPSLNSNWTDVASLSEPGMRNPSTLAASVAFDSIGNAVALWTTSFDDVTFNLESAVKPVNGNWSAPTDLVASNLYANSADLSVTTFGDTLGLYLFYNGASLLIQSVESDINGFLNNIWSVPITTSLGTQNAYPQIAATLTGNAIHVAAVWTHFDGANNVIVASTGSRALVLPPTNLSVTQTQSSISVFPEYYNTLSWNASVDPNVVGYLVFRNGLFLEQVGANVSQYVDNNRAHNGPVTYSITAIDNQQTQSVTVSVSFP